MTRDATTAFARTLVDGIESRAATVATPGWIRPLLPLRGLAGPLMDEFMVANPGGVDWGEVIGRRYPLEGLTAGGSCRGVVMRVADRDARPVWDYLAVRELRHDVYEVREVGVTAPDGRQVAARAFVVRRDHPSGSFGNRVLAGSPARKCERARYRGGS